MIPVYVVDLQNPSYLVVSTPVATMRMRSEGFLTIGMVAVSFSVVLRLYLFQATVKFLCLLFTKSATKTQPTFRIS